MNTLALNKLAGGSKAQAQTSKLAKLDLTVLGTLCLASGQTAEAALLG